MGWRIDCIGNTVEISAKLKKQIFKASLKHGCEEFVVVDEERLWFSPDAKEHMDYLSGEAPWVIDILTEGEVKGRILFRDTESCNQPEYWGHEFDGKGGYTRLAGTETITWAPMWENGS